MPSKALPISPAVAQLLRDRRESLGLTLRRVEELSGASGSPIPHSTLARIELGRFDPGVRRLGQLLALYQLPIQAAGDVLEVEALAGAIPMERDPAKLNARANEAWRQGKIPEALAAFLAFRRRVPKDDDHRAMRHEAILSFAVAAGGLGKLYLSRHMLDELLLDNPEPERLVRILIQLSVVWHALGSPVAALAFLDSAATYAQPHDPREQGLVQHQRAQILIDQRQYAAAAKCLALAVKHCRRAKAPYDEGRAMLSIVRLKFESGQPKAALAEARLAEKFAAKHKANRIRLCALVDQARAHLALGSPDEAKQRLRTVLADPATADDNRLAFFAHFYLWQAERAAGNAGRTAVELREASYYRRFVDQNSPESKILKQELGGTSHAGRPLGARVHRRGSDRDRATQPRRSRSSDGARRI